MSKQLLGKLLGAEAALLLVFCLLRLNFRSLFPSLLAFPFAQIALGLRGLSLSGSAGNLLALVLYATLCLLPLGLLLFLGRKRALRWEDGLLVLLSALLFAVLYLMINPAALWGLLPLGEISQLGGPELFLAYQGILSCIPYSVMVGYGILRLLRRFEKGTSDSLIGYLRLLLSLLAVLLVFDLFGVGLFSLADALGGVPTVTDALSPMGGFLSLPPSGFSMTALILQHLVAYLPAFFGLLILRAAFSLLDALEQGPYHEAVAPAARNLGLVCKKAVIWVLVTQIAMNTAQLLFSSLLLSSQYTVHIPLDAILLMLASLLLAKYFEAGRTLKEENDLFV